MEQVGNQSLNEQAGGSSSSKARPMAKANPQQISLGPIANQSEVDGNRLTPGGVGLAEVGRGTTDVSVFEARPAGLASRMLTDSRTMTEPNLLLPQPASNPQSRRPSPEQSHQMPSNVLASTIIPRPLISTKETINLAASDMDIAQAVNA